MFSLFRQSSLFQLFLAAMFVLTHCGGNAVHLALFHAHDTEIATHSHRADKTNEGHSCGCGNHPAPAFTTQAKSAVGDFVASPQSNLPGESSTHNNCWLCDYYLGLSIYSEIEPPYTAGLDLDLTSFVVTSSDDKVWPIYFSALAPRPPPA